MATSAPGLLLPNSFLPVARDNGLMGALTDLVLTRAADDAARWSADGREISFAVNLFPPSLTDLIWCPESCRCCTSADFRAACSPSRSPRRSG